MLQVRSFRTRYFLGCRLSCRKYHAWCVRRGNDRVRYGWAMVIDRRVGEHDITTRLLLPLRCSIVKSLGGGRKQVCWRYFCIAKTLVARLRIAIYDCTIWRQANIGRLPRDIINVVTVGLLWRSMTGTLVRRHFGVEFFCGVGIGIFVEALQAKLIFLFFG